MVQTPNKKAYQRAYREAHKEELSAYQRAYYEVHKAEVNAKCRAYRQAHKENMIMADIERDVREQQPQEEVYQGECVECGRFASQLTEKGYCEGCVMQAAIDAMEP